MSTNEELNAKLKEIQELVSKLAVAVDQLLQALAPSQPPSQLPAQPPTQPPAPVQPTAPSIADELKKRLDPALYNLLTITEDQTAIIIKPKGYLGTENFIKLASTVREFGGKYVSAGKESHFRIERKA